MHPAIRVLDALFARFMIQQVCAFYVSGELVRFTTEYT